ncbi:MAG: cytochrome c [Vicinamibacterales bacterium]
MTLLVVGAALAVPSVASAQADKGAQVFAAQKCSMCHAVAGKGNAKGPLDGVGAKYSAADLKEWIVNAKVMMEKTKATRKPAMKDFSTLPAADVDNLVAYLRTLK